MAQLQRAFKTLEHHGMKAEGMRRVMRRNGEGMKRVMMQWGTTQAGN